MTEAQTLATMENIEILFSDRRTVAVEIRPDLRVIVRAPRHMKRAEIERFIDEKASWIETHLEIMKKRVEAREKSGEAPRKSGEAPLSPAEIEALSARAREVIPPRAEALARLVGVTYGRVTVRHQVSRWGSCSSKGNLNFNCLLMLCPEGVLDYVILHELCHRKEMNHSKRFWSEVEKHCPDYKAQKAWLKNSGGALIRRIRRELPKN